MFPDLTRDDVFRLETRRLWLRWPRLADVQAIVRLAGEKAVAEMTALIPHPYAEPDAEEFVFQTRRANANGEGLALAITPKGKPAAVIGMVGVAPSLESGEPHLGYWLGRPFWNQGFATEAARALVDAFFTYTPAAELTSSARVVNPASRRVLDKCGFAFQGSGLKAFSARGGLVPVDHFRLDRRAWESLKAWGRTEFVPDGPPANPQAAGFAPAK
jgi:RimJ/RimL family protein N-acetyltransferase